MTKKWLWLIALAGLMGGNVLCVNAEEWKTVFADEFNRTDMFGADWVIKSGKWDIRGQLKGIGPGAVMMCTRRFQVPFRIEYECSSDNPCDLSLQFNGALEKGMLCYVGFGSQFNTKNLINTAAGGEVVVSRENLIEPGRRHRVVVTATETTVSQTIDGKESVKTDIKFPRKGVYFGLNIWTDGAFKYVKVYSPNAMDAIKTDDSKVAEAQPQVSIRKFKSFEDWPVGAIAGTNCAVKSGEKCSVKIADVPTWLYHNVKDEFRGYKENEEPEQVKAMMAASQNKGARLVSDRCVELASESGDGKEKASVSFPVPAMRNGMVEFEVMADQYTGDAMRIRLGEKCALLIDKDGTFYWETGDKKLKLADKINYTAIGGNARLYLWPQRWYTVRIDFDLATSLANVALINMYHSCHRFERLSSDISQYFSIGEDLPLPADTVPNITFETAGAGRFYIDNLFCISRTPELADDLKWRVQAREIMPVYYHLRKDPPTLKIWSLRNVRNTFWGAPAGDEFNDLSKTPEKYPVIMESSKLYNDVLIEQAFLAEKLRGLERAYFYLGTKLGEPAGKYGDRMIQTRRSVVETEALLAQLFRFYADCYLDKLNQEKMKEGFTRRYEALKAAIAKSDGMVGSTYKDMISKTSAKAGPIACQYEQRTETEPLTYSDGSYRRGGKREFIFTGGGDMSPYMHKSLSLGNYGCLATGWWPLSTQEPAYFLPFNQYWNDREVASFAANVPVSIKIHYATQYTSILPAWWVEKHKADQDIYLRNMKGEVTLGKDPTTQPFNYWNPDVLAAQKAYLQAIIDVMSGIGKDYPKRVMLIVALIPQGGNHEACQAVTREKAFWALLADMAS